MTFVPNSGPINTTMINAAFGLGEDLTLYHGVRWYYPANLTTGLFNATTIKLSDFYGKQGNDPATSGSYFSNIAGSGSFVAPLYRNKITIEIWGAGGGGGSSSGSDGANGGDTSISNYQPISGGTITTDYTAGGGKGGQGGIVPTPPPPLPVDVARGGGRQYSYTAEDAGGLTLTHVFNPSGTEVGQIVQNSSGAVVGQAGDTGAYGLSTPP